MRVNRRVLIVGLLAALVIVALVLRPNVSSVTEDHRWRETRQNAYAIQLAAERYFEQHGVYPADSLELEASMPRLPLNPYRTAGEPVYMRNVDLDAPDHLGNYTYLPWSRAGEDGYSLFVYAARKQSEQAAAEPAWKHIALHLGGSRARQETAK